MNFQNEQKLQQDFKLVQFMKVTSVILAVTAASLFFLYSMLKPEDASATTELVSSGNIVYASDDPFASLGSGDTIKLEGKFFLDQDYDLHKNDSILIIIDGTNAELKLFSGNNLWLGSGSNIKLFNKAKIKIVGKCDSTTAIYVDSVIVASCDGSLGTSFSGLNNGGSLPVDWLEVSAKIVANREVELNWSTASELNNEYFAIEYSENGEDWIEDQQIPSQAIGGTSQSVLHYKTNHFAPAYYSALYYRIKQVDYNNDFDYSDVMHLDFKNEKLLRVATLGNSQIKLSYMDKLNSTTMVNIYNINGSLVLSQGFVNGQTITLSNPGIYIIEVISGTDVKRVKQVVK